MDRKLLNEYDKPAKEHYYILFLSWAGWVFDFYDLTLYTFLLIPIGKELHLTNMHLSYILGISLAATAIGGILFGVLADYFGRRSVLQWTIITYSIGTFLSGLAPDFNFLILFRIITGIGVGGEWATGQTYVGETFPPNVRGRFGAFMQTGAPVGVALAALVGGFLSPLIGWRASFMISVLPAVLVIIIRRKLPESDLWEERKRLISLNQVSSQVIKEETGNNFLELFSKKYVGMFIKALLLGIFLMSAYWFTYSWLPGYLYEQRHFSITKSGLWMIITQTGGFIGYGTFGFVADRLGRRPAFTIYAFLMAAGLVMITLMWSFIASYPYIILVFMFMVGFGTGFFSGYGPLMSELFPTKIRNTAMGTAFNLARGIQFFTPVIIVIVSRYYGLGGGISIAALFAILVGLWVWVFPETKGKKLTALTQKME
ncbi:MAG: MFS transporter [Deltaproteobacteria bacterium]|nr:MFS transporter [Deltaproteobacteria bacterium]MCL5793048.1 MFS transporter [Deltaproteobacteria bacterium]